MRLSLMLILVAALSAASVADVYNLTNDFSEVNNPNGVWTLAAGNMLLSKFDPTQPNAINAVVANGYWGLSSGSYESTIMRVTGDGSDAPGYNDNDFLIGDVIAHGTNPGGSGPLQFIWTAPDDGDLSVEGLVWYAHSPVDRVADFALSLNGATILDSGMVSAATNRMNAVLFDSGGSIAVTAGDEIRFALSASDGQQFASLAGVDFTVDFTAVPAPSVLGVLGFWVFGGVRRRRS